MGMVILYKNKLIIVWLYVENCNSSLISENCFVKKNLDKFID